MCEQGSHLSRIESFRSRFDGLEGDDYFLALIKSETGDGTSNGAPTAEDQAQLILDGQPQELPNANDDPHAGIIASLGSFGLHYYKKYYERGSQRPVRRRPIA